MAMNNWKEEEYHGLINKLGKYFEHYYVGQYHKAYDVRCNISRVLILKSCTNEQLIEDFCKKIISIITDENNTRVIDGTKIPSTEEILNLFNNF